MDWGLGNPNKTAALIAMLIVAVWVLAYIRKWGFWLALALFTGLGLCLIHTYSRGGLIGAFFGLIVVVLNVPRPWPMKKIVAVGVSVWIIIGFSIYLQAQERFSQGLLKEDSSITNRLEIWKAAPQMMVSAPNGWGLGKSGQVFMQWYQPLNHMEAYRTLVNSHLTWMVEFGWPFRIFYILAWVAVLVVCWPSKDHRWLAIPLGVWVSFAVTSIFSSVAESGWMWILPGLSIVAAIIYRISRKTWPSRVVWMIPLGATALLNLVFFMAGQNGAIHKSGNVIVVGNGDPKLWMLINTKTIGSQYGRSVRKFLESHKEVTGSLACVESLDAINSPVGKTVVISGTPGDADKSGLKAVCDSASKVILLNPTFPPQEINFDKSKSVSVLFGEFSQSPAIQSWKDAVAVQNIEGKGDFLPNWPELVFNHE